MQNYLTYLTVLCGRIAGSSFETVVIYNERYNYYVCLHKLDYLLTVSAYTFN